jgi:MFS family permease
MIAGKTRKGGNRHVEKANGDAPLMSQQDQSLATAKSYRYVALGLLVAAYVCSFIDRQVLSILQQAIKVDLHLSDTELGLLGGLAFAVFYTAFGIPIARLADHHSRSKIIAVSLALWSVMTAACGLAQNFLMLALARIGVGVGEAGCSPPAHSLLADYFPLRQRSTAFGIYTLGIPIGGALGLLIGGYVNNFLGWRVAFFMVGLPGVILALIIGFVLKEPPRGLSEGHVQSAAKPPPLGEVWRAIKERKAFHHICLAFALTAFAGYGTQQWYPTYFIRTFHLDTGTVGLVSAIASAAFGGVSTFAGGWLADRLSGRDVRWICWLPAIALTLSIPFAIMVLLQQTFHNAVVFLFIGSLFTGVHLGPVFGVNQTLFPLRMRALAASVLLFVTNLVGLGFGPTLVGIESDLWHGLGIDAPSGFGAFLSLRIAIGTNAVVTLWAVLHYFLAARTLREDIARAG